ncbi:cell division protein ZapA [Alkalibacter rhizosphaerae]|uniref:Cell division protein ZapA n=1 Tax=Alkalibacter rhizosphaerae TaxID=2815577 RepID=A0A974XFB3_9FIRM|nr:cell division protein ZapA [Alkalibacter rhizosphaerae]QSX08807.1 cell division protein ZapA [Alkalibacter rhizosphaerae]
MDKLNRVTAKVDGAEYSLIGEISQEYMDEICQTVNELLTDIRKTDPLMNRNLALLLCALNLSEQLKFKDEKIKELTLRLGDMESVEELREQIRIYKEYANRNNEIYKELAGENEKLKEEMEAVKQSATQVNKKMRQYKYDVEESRKTILDLQNQLFESQIELVKANKNSGYDD